MKIAILVINVIALVAVVVVVSRRKSAVELTAAELKVRDAVREVYAGNIVSERVVIEGSDKRLIAELRNENLKELNINLSSLARKLENEGLSVPALKASLRF